MYVGIGIAVVLVLAVLWFFVGPILPKGSKAAMEEALRTEVPDYTPGKHAETTTSGVRIWYESHGDPTQETILLIMGHSCSALVWQPHFYQPLVEAGYHVIRYDNRGVGLSDWLPNWEQNKYNLEDMARDAMAILDDLGVAKAHIVGASMGGMIAQRIALSHTERVLSLTSIMSTGFFFDPGVKQYNLKLAFIIGRLYLRYGFQRSEKSFMALRIGIREALSGPVESDRDLLETCRETLFEFRNRNGFNVETKTQHGYAIKKSGSRLEELGKIQVPTVVIHGDKDPLIMSEHAEKYAPLIPDAEFVMLEGMGHTFPKVYMPQIFEAMERVFERSRTKVGGTV